jgi:predicted transcriptional regulator
MPAKARTLVLTEAQAACLVALRNHKEAKTRIAIEAGLDLKQTEDGLVALKQLGLARRDGQRRWKPTRRGAVCRFKTIALRKRRRHTRLGRSARRLLQLLHRPRHSSELAEGLGLSRQRIRQLLVKLHAQGRIKFADEELTQMVSRTGDTTPLLPRHEGCVLSVMPSEYSTNVTRIRLAAGLTEKQTQAAIEGLLAGGFAETTKGLDGETVYRISAAGLRHPQCSQKPRRARPPRLPVESDRVCTVLSALLERGSMRINEARDTLRIPHDSIRALMQYLKRKALVRKTEQALLAPYELTEKGHGALSEMLRRRAA